MEVFMQFIDDKEDFEFFIVESGLVDIDLVIGGMIDVYYNERKRIISEINYLEYNLYLLVFS